MDDSTKRALRFSLFLQGFTALLFGTATFVRASAEGITVLTVVFALGFLLACAALVFTTRYLRSH
ncbi:MAG: hypothetical protein ACR2JS_00035 [Candidatus Nanopelagicales bacterium]